jgi:hypothetical protein
MANRISLKVETKKRRIYLPSLPIFTLPFMIKTMLRMSKEHSAQSFYHQNKRSIKKGLRLLVKELRKMEPMELISIESKDAVVFIRLK